MLAPTALRLHRTRTATSASRLPRPGACTYLPAPAVTPRTGTPPPAARGIFAGDTGTAAAPHSARSPPTRLRPLTSPILSFYSKTWGQEALASHGESLPRPEKHPGAQCSRRRGHILRQPASHSVAYGTPSGEVGIGNLERLLRA